ncbi:hypothetical protein Q2K19_05425 [Micromonospora soli]|uniref:hypothetical protein n=1 Tax=Micromonospora sp. NBRC 110009 TaxID=3061627 RepID=UPI002671EDB8|nr:hypothetical protein [Micromonospora sp. NBRC 110009]WKT99930.1 hypothetical protein Q2K19_05425 [Micromonospora sp. NBRC 110009]
MTEPDETGSGWRARWATRENKRRQRAYEDAVEAWSLRGIRLLRLRAAAEQPLAGSPDRLPVALADGEIVVAVQPKAELVEVRAGRHADLPTPELAMVPVRRKKRGRRLPHGLRVADVGTALVTDRRVILLGRKEDRELAFPLLSGLAHYPTAPVTLLHTADGRPLTGLRVPGDDAARFRLGLTMAYADFLGQRPTVLARLDRAVAANRRSLPPVPVAATAEQAPASARLARPAMIAAAVALLALPAYAMMGDPRDAFDGGVADAPLRSPLPEPGTGTGSGDAATTSPPGGAPTTASAAPRTTVPGGAAGAPTPHPVDPGAPRRSTSTPRPVPRPTPPPNAGPGPGRPTDAGPGPVSPTPAPPTASGGQPTPIPADRCGAPENPYGYNYCGGDLVQEPAAGVCSYFTCVDGFWAGKGYLIVCDDGRIGMVGGPTGRCPERAGRKDPVYATLD